MKTIFSTELNSINGGSPSAIARAVISVIFIILSQTADPVDVFNHGSRKDDERRDDRDTDRDARHHFKF